LQVESFLIRFERIEIGKFIDKTKKKPFLVKERLLSNVPLPAHQILSTIEKFLQNVIGS
jgi:hypothetical protein